VDFLALKRDRKGGRIGCGSVSLISIQRKEEMWWGRQERVSFINTQQEKREQWEKESGEK